MKIGIHPLTGRENTATTTLVRVTTEVQGLVKDIHISSILFLFQIITDLPESPIRCSYAIAVPKIDIQL